MSRPWVFGIAFGVGIGSGGVLLSSLKYGFSAPLLLIGVILTIGFGAAALAGEFVRKRTHID